MAKFIVLMSGKGGVGKTTSAINLGLALTKLGLSTIVLDGNLSSPNLTVHLGTSYYPKTIHDVMQDNEHITNAIYNHPSGLRIIPADIAIDSMKFVNFENLNKHLQDLHITADYVIIDGSPGLGRESTQLIQLSDEVLVITNPETSAIIDAKRLIDFAKKFNKTIAGLVVNKYQNKKHKLSLEEIEKFLGMPVLSRIPHDERFSKALHKRMPYIHIYPKRKASKAYHELAQRISGRVKY